MKTSSSPQWISAGAMLIAMGLACIVGGCGAPIAAPPPATAPAPPTIEAAPLRGQGGTLTLLYFQAPTIVNPHLSQGDKDLSASRITYEPLASFNKDGEMIPILAAEIPNLKDGTLAADGASVTWQLKPGVKWADGEPFTADDVVFTYQYITNPTVQATSSAAYANISHVEALDDYTVKVSFTKPTTSWYAPFVGPFGMIIPRHVFEAYNGANAAEAPANTKALGTGPYFVSEFRLEDVLIIGGNAVSTNKIIYEINRFYRDPDKPFFSRVELRGGGDLDTAVAAGKEGVADFVWNTAVSEDELVDAESSGKALAIGAPSSFVERIMFNFTDPNRETEDGERSSMQYPHPILSDPVVRRAIVLAINREVIATPYGRGGVLTTNILVEPATYVSDNNTYNHDPQAAAQLLDQAGWGDADGDGVREKEGMELRLTFQTSIQALRQRNQAQVKKRSGGDRLCSGAKTN